MNIHLPDSYQDGSLTRSMMYRNGVEVFSAARQGNTVLAVAHKAWKWQRGLVQRYFMGGGNDLQLQSAISCSYGDQCLVSEYDDKPWMCE